MHTRGNYKGAIIISETILKRRLSEDEIKQLALIVVQKNNGSKTSTIANSVLRTYVESIEFFESENQKVKSVYENRGTFSL